MSRLVEVEVEKLMALFRQYDAAKPPIRLMNEDGRLESEQEKAKRIAAMGEAGRGRK